MINWQSRRVSFGLNSVLGGRWLTSGLLSKAAVERTAMDGREVPTTDIQVTASCTNRQLVKVLPARPGRGGRVFCAAVCRRRCVPLARRKLADCAQPVFDMVGAHELVGFDGVNIDRHESE